jgi:phospholipid/cholesterol/gamma-HCH transport system ATP-binding protein
MTVSPFISLQNIRVAFGNQVVHRDISFDIYPGEVVTILGPSGTGKTVLLKLMVGLLFPDSGRVLVEGKDLSKLSDEQLRGVRLKVGMLFQGAALFDSLTVFDNIAFPLREYGTTAEDKIAEIVKSKLDLVNLPETINKYPPALSGGQKKRVGLARAMATSPRVLLFDEPTTGLDPTSRGKIDDLITELRNRYGITSVVVTHDMDSAQKVSDRLILVHNGSVVATGPAHSLWEDNLIVKHFVSGSWDKYQGVGE